MSTPPAPSSSSPHEPELQAQPVLGPVLLDRELRSGRAPALSFECKTAENDQKTPKR